MPSACATSHGVCFASLAYIADAGRERDAHALAPMKVALDDAVTLSEHSYLSLHLLAAKPAFREDGLAITINAQELWLQLRTVLSVVEGGAVSLASIGTKEGHLTLAIVNELWTLAATRQYGALHGLGITGELLELLCALPSVERVRNTVIQLRGHALRIVANPRAFKPAVRRLERDRSTLSHMQAAIALGADNDFMMRHFGFSERCSEGLRALNGVKARRGRPPRVAAPLRDKLHHEWRARVMDAGRVELSVADYIEVAELYGIRIDMVAKVFQRLARDG